MELNNVPGPTPRDTLCWSCRYATPLMCRWARDAISGQTPEYVECSIDKLVTRQTGKVDRQSEMVTVKIITRCQKHEPGSLPRPGKVWPQPREGA